MVQENFIIQEIPIPLLILVQMLLCMRFGRTMIIITYDSNGGTGTMAAQSAKGETAVKLTKNVFQRAGYLFTGWATDRYA